MLGSNRIARMCFQAFIAVFALSSGVVPIQRCSRSDTAWLFTNAGSTPIILLGEFTLEEAVP